jgi:hypothetical protein
MTDTTPDAVRRFIRALADQCEKPDAAAAAAWAAGVPEAVRGHVETCNQLLDRLQAELRRRDQERHAALLRESVGSRAGPFAAPAAAPTAAAGAPGPPGRAR